MILSWFILYHAWKTLFKKEGCYVGCLCHLGHKDNYSYTILFCGSSQFVSFSERHTSTRLSNDKMISQT